MVQMVELPTHNPSILDSILISGAVSVKFLPQTGMGFRPYYKREQMSIKSAIVTAPGP